MGKLSFRLLAVVGLLAISGCQSGLPPLGTDEKPSLGSVEIRNDDAESHTIDVLIVKNDKIVYWTTREVAGNQNNTIHSAILVPGRFADTPGEYVISARVNNESTGKRFALSEVANGGCYGIQVRIEEDENITFLTSKGAYECEQSTATTVSR